MRASDGYPFAAKSDDANLVLGQLGNKLVMAMKGGAKPSELCALTAGEPVDFFSSPRRGHLLRCVFPSGPTS